MNENNDNIKEILIKWNDCKTKLSILEKKIEKYKAIIGKEMNKKGVDKIAEGGITVQRRRNTRTFLSKENVPIDIWKEYSTKCSYDAFFLSKI